MTPTTNTWYSLRITVQGSTIRCALNGDTRFEVTDTALTAGKIGFRTNWGQAGFDDVVVKDLTAPAPAAPTGLAAGSITDTSVSLTWNTVPEATVYRLYRSSSATGTFQPIYKGTDASYQDTGLTKGTTYHYKVTYETADGLESASSDTISAKTTIPLPGVPTGLSVAKINSQSAEFRWSQATDATSYNLYRATQPGGPYTLINPVNQNLYISTNGIDCQLTPETTYYYTVSAVNPTGESAKSAEVKVTTPKPEDDFIQNAGFWCPDNNASVIQGHGGYILQVGDTYYWYGEDKSQNNASFLNVAAYASKDLVHWSFRNNILTVNSAPELADAKIERPKVLYNAATHKYVMWGHKEPAANYNEAKVAVAVSDTPDGNFTYLGSFNPLGDQSRDFTLFQDDDGTAYLISSANNNLDLNVYQLTPDYLNVQTRIAVLYAGQRREAPAVVKKDGIYYLFTSGQSGWAPNQGKYATATSMAGPWSAPQNFGDNWSFYTQPAFILTVKGTTKTTYIYAGDRWHPNKLGASEYIWLPLTLDSVNRTATMDYVSRFKLNVTTGDLLAPSVQLISSGAGVTATTSSSGHDAGLANDGSYSTYWEASNKTLPVSVNIDLGEAKSIGRIDLTWRGVGGSEAYYQYKIYGSIDNATYTQLADRSTNTDLGFTSDNIVDTAKYRYLRITVSKYINFTNGNPPGYNPGLYEIKVFSKADQTITFPAIPDKTYGDADFKVAATTTWGLPVSFAANGTCTITSATVHLTGAGNCTITASQAGDGNFKPAADMAQTFTVAKASTNVKVAVTPSPVQYSDMINLNATVSPVSLGDQTLSGSVEFFISGGGLSKPLSVGSAQIDSTGVATLPYKVELQPDSAYTVTANFTSTNANFTDNSDSTGLTVTKEDTVVTPASTNPSVVQVATAGGASPSFNLSASIKEVADGSPGDISKVTPVNFSLVPIGPGSTVNCTAGSGTLNGSELAVSCAFTNVPVNVYDVVITVGGKYYQGSAHSILTVYDPSLGFTTGGGILIHSGVRADFGFNVKYLKNGQAQGQFIYIEHRPTGDVVVKSNVLDTLAIIKSSPTSSTAVFTGKATNNGVGNYTFQVTGVDNGEPGTNDQFGLKLSSPGGAVVADLTFDPLTLNGGNIQIHQE
ncbi:family 43 glycosylhydrolase [Dictyobacter formicarum]|uniref:family 43 glycosylhydrolase n=1 Tax=Dictyobacter formicarum TaxID=2778368 RepID=UPI001915AA60|nr:family 43 glycosylhydrolase [Dictyobacter formicarum]